MKTDFSIAKEFLRFLHWSTSAEGELHSLYCSLHTEMYYWYVEFRKAAFYFPSLGETCCVTPPRPKNDQQHFNNPSQRTQASDKHCLLFGVLTIVKVNKEWLIYTGYTVTSFIYEVNTNMRPKVLHIGKQRQHKIKLCRTAL